ncbi:Alpha/Beta hydrolase protein [Podospora conica]|nr:Alpha/Beta hydrolase protein [Schizothecium conicum]
MGAVAHLITRSLPDTTLASVDYPATFSDYPSSQTLGVLELRRMIISHSARCPDTKLALLGFSQGGHVIMDVLCGRPGDSDGGWEAVERLGGDGHGVVGVVTFGDPSHVAGAGFNRGTSVRDGLFPRQDIAACDPYTPVIREWCDTGDEFCDRGNNTKTHAGYFGRYMGAAAEFIVERYNASLPERDEPTAAAPQVPVPEGSTSGAKGLTAPVALASGLLMMMPAVLEWMGL